MGAVESHPATWLPTITPAQALAAAIAEQPRLVSNGTAGRILPADQHFGA